MESKHTLLTRGLALLGGLTMALVSISAPPSSGAIGSVQVTSAMRPELDATAGTAAVLVPTQWMPNGGSDTPASGVLATAAVRTLTSLMSDEGADDSPGTHMT
jgi:hypothetical protein